MSLLNTADASATAAQDAHLTLPDPCTGSTGDGRMSRIGTARTSSGKNRHSATPHNGDVLVAPNQ